MLEYVIIAIVVLVAAVAVGRSFYTSYISESASSGESCRLCARGYGVPDEGKMRCTRN